MNDRDKWKKLFLLYNEELSETFEKVMENCVNEEQVNDVSTQEQLRNHILNNMQVWYNKPLECLENKTPAEMIDEIETVEDAISCVKIASASCDDDIPEYLKIKLGSFGAEAIVHLVKVAKTPSWEADCNCENEPPAEDILCAASALRILGEWQMEQTLDEILTKFVAAKMPHELLADAFKSYITAIGDVAIPSILKYLDKAFDREDELTGAYEYLIITLTLSAQEMKDDKTFACLRNCFRTMPHKVTGAICLGDYGDPRGITVLKGYLDRNEEKFDRQEFYEILSSIKRLGGDTSNIKDPFKDFSAF